MTAVKRSLRRLFVSVTRDDLFLRVAWSLAGILFGGFGVALLIAGAATDFGALSYVYWSIVIPFIAGGAIMVSRCALSARSRLARLLDKHPPDAAAEEGVLLVAIVYLPAACLTILLRSLGVRGQRTGYKTFAGRRRSMGPAATKSDDEDEPVALPEQYALVKVLRHPTGNQRVLIVERPDGRFSYWEQERVPVYPADMAGRLRDDSTVWTPRGRSAVICDTAETAEREARGVVTWL